MLGNHFREQQGDCPVDAKTGMSCLSVQYDIVNICKNMARFSGGGVFLSASLNISLYCQMPQSLLNSSCIQHTVKAPNEVNKVAIEGNWIEVSCNLST